MEKSLREILDEVFDGDCTRMAGTDETYEYVVLAATSLGRVGYRSLGASDYEPVYRIRVEPVNHQIDLSETLCPEDDWKQPGDDRQDRYSKVVVGRKQLHRETAIALKALRVGQVETLIGLDLPRWFMAIVSKISANIDGAIIKELYIGNNNKPNEQEDYTVRKEQLGYLTVEDLKQILIDQGGHLSKNLSKAQLIKRILENEGYKL